MTIDKKITKDERRKGFVWFIFSNISVISWRSVLLVEETGVPNENHGLVASH